MSGQRLRRAAPPLRGTGVFHDDQTVSFQLVLPSDHPKHSGDVHKNYQLIAGTVIDMLTALGVHGRSASLEEARHDAAPPGLEAICFSSVAPFEVLADERKLVGLAQVRRRTVSALQGMVYLKLDAARSVTVLLPDSQPRERLSSILSDRTTDLSRAAGRTIEAREVVVAFQRAALATLDADSVEAPLTEWRSIERESWNRRGTRTRSGPFATDSCGGECESGIRVCHTFR